MGAHLLADTWIGNGWGRRWNGRERVREHTSVSVHVDAEAVRRVAQFGALPAADGPLKVDVQRGVRHRVRRVDVDRRLAISAGRRKEARPRVRSCENAADADAYDSGPPEKHKRGTRTVRGVVSPAFLDVRHVDRRRRTEKIQCSRRRGISRVAEYTAI